MSTEDGSTKRMTDLRIGDRVAVVRPDGSRGFDDIYLFTHKDQVDLGALRHLDARIRPQAELVAQALHPGRDGARLPAGKLTC